MPFNDSKEGQTHYENDGCGEPAHNIACVFCDREKITNVVKEFGDCIVFEPLNPVTPGHLLVVPKKHVQDFTADDKVVLEVFKAASFIADSFGGDYNLITSKGKAATQSVFHFHVHLVPRKDGDGLLLPWSHQKRVSSMDVTFPTIQEGDILVGPFGVKKVKKFAKD